MHMQRRERYIDSARAKPAPDFSSCSTSRVVDARGLAGRGKSWQSICLLPGKSMSCARPWLRCQKKTQHCPRCLSRCARRWNRTASGTRRTNSVATPRPNEAVVAAVAEMIESDRRSFERFGIFDHFATAQASNNWAFPASEQFLVSSAR